MKRFGGPHGMPPGWSHSAGMNHPGFEHARTVTVAARERPGEWVDFATGMTGRHATSKVWQIRHKPSMLFRPPGMFEARRQERADGHAVQIRYVGEPS